MLSMKTTSHVFREVPGDKWRLGSASTPFHICWWHLIWWTYQRWSFQFIHSIQEDLLWGRIQPEKFFWPFPNTFKWESTSRRVQTPTIHHCRISQPSLRVLLESAISEKGRTQGLGSTMEPSQSQTDWSLMSLTLPELLSTCTQLNKIWSVLSAGSTIHLDFSLQ